MASGKKYRCSRNEILSILAGLLFAIGWWIIIDVLLKYQTKAEFNRIFLLIGILATLALIVINSISIRTDPFKDRCLKPCVARTILFFALIMAFGCIITSIWIFIAYYLRLGTDKVYPGVALIIQNMTIFLSTMILKLGRKET